MNDSHDVTQLLLKWSSGNQDALSELLPLVYRELQKIAHRYLSRERRSNTLQTTALVQATRLDAPSSAHRCGDSRYPARARANHHPPG